MDRLILIDGNAILHRAFHALPPLTSKKGEMVNAVYGFFLMFLRIVSDFKPKYLAICFDRPKPTFRKQLFVGYQAKRPKISEELVPQIKTVHEILEKAKISIFEIDGYEADDLIGTVARQAIGRGPAAPFPPASAPLSSLRTARVRAVGSLSSRVTPHFNMEVIIVSGDRDMLQLLNHHVKAAMPVTGITKMAVFDEKKTEEKYGIKPSQFIDYKALVGDASDNYPGVSGVGPKTTSSLLKEYETLEGIYKNLDKIALKNQNLAKKLAEGAEAAGLAKKLATIVTDVPITLDIEKCSFKHFDREGMRKAFEELGFKSLLNRLEGTTNTEGAEKSAEVQKKDAVQEKNKQMELL